MPEVVSISVGAILHHDPGLGGAIFSGNDESGAHIRVIVPYTGISRVPELGETWRVEGDFHTHPKYGQQLKATRCHYVAPKGRLLIQYLARSKSFPGIGLAIAEKLYAKFGDELPDVLTSCDQSRLSDVVSSDLAAMLIAVWQERYAEMELIAYLDQHGFAMRLATKLRQCWGDAARSMLDTNPYLMLAVAGWGVVDAAASKLGIATDDPRRLIGAVESAMYSRLNVGHTLTGHAATVKLVARLLGPRKADSAIHAALEEGAIIGTPEAGYQPVGAKSLEDGIAVRLRAMMAGERPEQGLLFAAPTDENLAELIVRCEREQGFPLNDEQKAAVSMAVTRPFSLLLGGAGVGKTTVLRVVIEALEVQHWKVIQLALAGRAAQRMAEATGRSAMTIAKFLLHARSGKLEVPAQALVVIDEASMLDLPTLYRVMRHMPDGTRLLLVGDPAQLPPIGFGLTFHRLAASGSVPKTELTQVLRQAESTGIPAIAAAIRRHEAPVLTTFNGCRAGVSFIECSPREIVSKLFEVAAAWKNEDWRIIGSVKNPVGGIKDINWSFHHRFAVGQRCLDGGTFAVGDPIVFLHNDYERGLMNGSLGKVVDVLEADGQPSLQVSFDGDEHVLAGADLDNIELAYAITCHKAQGSQFKRIAVPITRSRILDHAMVYTALTRGVEQVVFVGDVTAFRDAIRSLPSASRREVAFNI